MKIGRNTRIVASFISGLAFVGAIALGGGGSSTGVVAEDPPPTAPTTTTNGNGWGH